MTNLVFIGGTGRCGTHILKDTLSLHSKVCSLPFEYRFIIDPGGIVDFYNGSQSWSPYIIDRKLKELKWLLLTLMLEKTATYTDWQLDCHIDDFSGLVDGLMSELVDFGYQATWHGSKACGDTMWFAPHRDKKSLAAILGGFISCVVNNLLQANKAEVFVEDNTWNILFARELLELVPESKIIHIYRDPRDVVDSMRHQRWCPDDLYQASVFYACIMERWLEVKAKLIPDCFIEVKLEDLVEDSETVLQELCEFIGIEYEDDMMYIDLSKGNIGRWEKGLNDEDKLVALPILEPYVARLGYK